MHTLWAGYADAVTTDDSLSCLIEFITILCRNARMHMCYYCLPRSGGFRIASQPPLVQA